ncbi:hypothetical protein LTR16_011299, partial [Cryomyces antarcticus]
QDRRRALQEPARRDPGQPRRAEVGPRRLQVPLPRQERARLHLDQSDHPLRGLLHGLDDREDRLQRPRGLAPGVEHPDRGHQGAEEGRRLRLEGEADRRLGAGPRGRRWPRNCGPQGPDVDRHGHGAEGRAIQSPDCHWRPEVGGV